MLRASPASHTPGPLGSSGALFNGGRLDTTKVVATGQPTVVAKKHFIS